MTAQRSGRHCELIRNFRGSCWSVEYASPFTRHRVYGVKGAQASGSRVACFLTNSGTQSGSDHSDRSTNDHGRSFPTVVLQCSCTLATSARISSFSSEAVGGNLAFVRPLLRELMFSRITPSFRQKVGVKSTSNVKTSETTKQHVGNQDPFSHQVHTGKVISNHAKRALFNVATTEQRQKSHPRPWR